jgi:hypothetical protein
MDLDRLSLELRRRNGWESLDLGFAMLRAWRAPVLRAWCCTYWPTAIVVSALLWEHPVIALGVMWWLKPLFDRVLLHVYSAAVFGTPPRTREVLRALPALVRRTRLLAGLTFYRLSFARSLFLAVWQLEGQRGKAARARRRVLGARGYGYATWLWFFCAWVVELWTIGGVLTIAELLPRETTFDFTIWQVYTYSTPWVALGHASNLIMFLAETMVEPCYVAAGFSLYLNRRSELEGWDLEVEFRRMAQRRSSTPIGAATALAIAVIASALLVAAAPQPALASDAPVAEAPQSTPPTSDATSSPSKPDASAAPSARPMPYPKGEIKRTMQEISDDPVFGKKEKDTRWVLRPGEEHDTGWLKRFLKWFGRIVEGTAKVGRVIVWILGALAVAAVVYLVVRHGERWFGRRRVRQIPDTLFGLDVRPESLPADIVAAAHEALARGDAVAALGLLYRGALSALIHFAAVDFRAGDTEGDCWRRAHSALSNAGSGYFRRLLDAWLRTAYAHRPPPATELASLCDDWPQHFRPEALSPEPAR